jgi:two-component system, OmpR family, sensor histidine kinase KdpD
MHDKNSTYTQPPGLRQALLHYAAAAGIIILVSVLLYIFKARIGYQTASLMLLFAVALMSLKFDVGPVLVAASVSALIWNFFFIPPRFTFAIGGYQDALLFITYFVIAAITGTLTARIHVRENRAVALYTLTRELIEAKTLNEVARTAVSNIASFFHSDVLLYLSEIDGDIFTHAHPASTMIADEKDYSVASWVYWNEKKAGKFVDIIPFSSATYYPISGPRYPLGVLGIRLRNERPLSAEQEKLLQNFIGQIASALEREQLDELAKQTIVDTESEWLYKTLFNSISHELRTPIAAIINAVETLEAPSAAIPSSSREFMKEIRTAAERLNRLVENLLDMTRLESGTIAAKRDWCDVRDIINAAAKNLEPQLRHHRLVLDIGSDGTLVKLDFGLMEQVMTNLLHNASIYTPEGTTITIESHCADRALTLIVYDNGPGFPPDALKNIFKKFFRIQGSKAGGTGLGLSIVQGFVEAHQGTITASNRPSGGAQFTLRIPTEIHSLSAAQTDND